jgi:hypothetical protein
LVKHHWHDFVVNHLVHLRVLVEQEQQMAKQMQEIFEEDPPWSPSENEEDLDDDDGGDEEELETLETEEEVVVSQPKKKQKRAAVVYLDKEDVDDLTIEEAISEHVKILKVTKRGKAWIAAERDLTNKFDGEIKSRRLFKHADVPFESMCK